jgi:ABC-type sugar transport system ATPase subunit
MTVYENIAYPLRCRKLKNVQIHKRVAELAEDFAIIYLLKRKVQTLSGGESQRISLARAVASEPRCLLLDEPISSLDAKSRPQMRALLRKINRQGQTIVHVTHDYTEAVSLGTHIAVMDAGRIAQAGTVEEVFQRPKSEFIARFVGIRNFFKGQLSTGRLPGAQVTAESFGQNDNSKSGFPILNRAKESGIMI